MTRTIRGSGPRQQVAGLLEDWTAAGLPPEPLVPIGADFLARLDGVFDEKHQAASSINDLARRVVAGEISFADALKEHQHLTAGDQAMSATNNESRRATLRLVVTQAFGSAMRQAFRGMSEVLVGQLQTAHDEAMREATGARGTLEGISTETEALQSDRTAKAWRLLTSAAEHRERILAAHKTLIEIGGLVYPKGEGLARTFRRTDLIPRVRHDAHPATRLRTLIDSGAEPAILSPQELAEQREPVAASR
jgi:hypothetical protein